MALCLHCGKRKAALNCVEGSFCNRCFKESQKLDIQILTKQYENDPAYMIMIDGAKADDATAFLIFRAIYNDSSVDSWTREKARAMMGKILKGD